MVNIFLATGFEEVEALTPVDILRRCGLEVRTVSISDNRLVCGAHGIPVEADAIFQDIAIADDDVLVLPGGMPGTKNLNNCELLCQTLSAHCTKGKLLAAICAAPMILGELGLLENKQATCYPGFENYLRGAKVNNELVVVDGNIITGKGPGAAAEFAFAIARYLLGDDVASRVRNEMQYQ